MSPQALNVTPNKTGELTIDGFDCNTVGWSMLNLLPLWVPAKTRGQNFVIPGVEGQTAVRARRDQNDVSLAMAFEGWYDGGTGLPYADPWAGLEANIAAFVAGVVVQPSLPAVTRTAVITLPATGHTKTAAIQVLGLTLGTNQRTQCRATLDIRIPAGRFT